MAAHGAWAWGDALAVCGAFSSFLVEVAAYALGHEARERQCLEHQVAVEVAASCQDLGQDLGQDVGRGVDQMPPRSLPGHCPPWPDLPVGPEKRPDTVNSKSG